MSGRPLARCADRAAYGESTAPRPVRLPIPPSCPIAVGRDRGIFGGARPPTLTFSSVAADLNDHGDTRRLGPACRSMRAQVERPASAPRRELRRFRWPRSRRFAPPALRGVQISPRPLLQCTSPHVARTDRSRAAPSSSAIGREPAAPARRYAYVLLTHCRPKEISNSRRDVSEDERLSPGSS
jgi:hypothetical protein